MKKKRYPLTKKSLFLVILFIFTNLISINLFKKVDYQNILISGEEFISLNDITENSSLKIPTRLIFIKTKLIEKELKKNISLKQISVTRQIFPFALKINIRKRIPVASAIKVNQGNPVKGFIDKEGVFIEKKYANLKNNSIYSITILGWDEGYKKLISLILNNYKNINDLEVINITNSGFIVLKDKKLREIYFGYETQDIYEKLNIISDIKNQLRNQKIKSLDITDPINPQLKVFIP